MHNNWNKKEQGDVSLTKRQTDLGKDKIGGLIIRLAVPSIAAQLVNALYNIVDRIYIGHIDVIGSAALTGVGVTFPLILIISAFSALIGMGGAPRAAIKMGAGDNEGAEKILGNCTSVLIGLSVVLTTVFMIFRDPLLMAFGASENTIGYASDYMEIYLIGTISVQLALGLNSFISTQGFATISMATVLIGAVTNIVLDPVFIYSFNMGVKGAAIATILSQTLSAIWVVIFLTGKKTKIKIRFSNFKLERKIILPALALGLSPFIMQSTESLVVVTLNSSLQSYGGDLAVGAMTILSSVMQLVYLPMQGLSQGAQPIISYNYGAGNKERVKKAFKVFITISLSYSITMWLFIMLLPQLLVRIFTGDAQLMETASWALRIYMAGIFAFGAQTACQQTFVSLGQANVSIVLALLRKIILLIPLVYILPLFIADKVLGVFLAEPFADVIAAIVTTIVFAVKFPKILKSKVVD